MESFRVELILLESALEIVPEEIRGHPQVLKVARRYEIDPSEMILDKSLHYNAMASLAQKWKRGRPDILHVALLAATDTPLREKGLLRIYFQSYDGRIFRLSDKVRVPKNYERFKGLMAQLLRESRVPPRGEPLIWQEYDNLRDYVRERGGLILLWERGRDASPVYVIARALATGYPLGVGAFPRGDFKKSTLRKASEAYRIMKGAPLKTWGVVGRLVYAVERLAGLI